MRRAEELIALFLVGCGGANNTPPVAPPPAAHWSYDEVASWEGSCKTGSHQSPIDLPASAPEQSLAMPSTYEPFPVRILNNGHTIQVEDSRASSLEMDGTSYKLAQFHFHSPSEHTVAGKSFDAEAHFVHKSADGKLLVLGILLAKGKSNVDLAPVFDAIPKANTSAQEVAGTIDPANLLPKSPRWSHYDGSLTTPPCSEGVSWFVDTTNIVEISDAQLAALRAPFHGDTRRPTQPLNGRNVVTIAR